MGRRPDVQQLWCHLGVEVMLARMSDLVERPRTSNPAVVISECSRLLSLKSGCCQLLVEHGAVNSLCLMLLKKAVSLPAFSRWRTKGRRSVPCDANHMQFLITGRSRNRKRTNCHPARTAAELGGTPDFGEFGEQYVQRR